MKILLTFAIVLLTNCAHTTLYQNNQKIAEIQSDATNVHYKSADVEFSAGTLDNSSATKASASRISLISAGLAGLTVLK